MSATEDAPCYNWSMTLEEIRKKHKLSLILMHGSQVTGKIHAKSDTDIAIVRKNDSSNFDLLALTADLTNYLKTNGVDLVDITHANPLLLFAVAKKSKLLAGTNEDYENLIYRAFHKYSDYLPYLKREADFVKERISTYA